jgi:prepilin-type N-terminal cleavage/methylation domain-containing protein
MFTRVGRLRNERGVTVIELMIVMLVILMILVFAAILLRHFGVAR